MSVSILAIDDELDVADLFLQHFRREVRQGRYVLQFAAAEALDKLARGHRARTHRHVAWPRFLFKPSTYFAGS
jgi:hypothetical protein